MPLESDTANYGSGLSFGGGADASAGPGNNGADVPPAQVQPMPSPAPDQGPSQPPDGEPTRPFSSFGASLHTFGQGLNKLMNGPSYTAPDPQATALDQTADTLQQRIQRANSVATNPVLGFFNPEGVKAARDFIPQATEQLQKIKAQKADMQANRQQAESLGLAPGETADEASQQDRVEAAVNGALKGDLKKFKGLQSVDPKRAEAIQDQVHEAVAGHLTKAQLAFDSLAGMQNQGQYTAKLDQLRKDGTLTDLEALGLKVPASYDQFGAAKAREGQALREARIGVDTIRQKLEERNTYQPMEEKEGKTYNGRLTTAYGDQVTNGTWARNGASGTRGLIVNGASDPRDLGKSFTLATPEQRKAISEEFEAALPKAAFEKTREFNRTYQLATTDAKGNDVPPGKINTNPNVQQGVSEGLASMLRGPTGSANVGLIKLELGKRGWSQGMIDGLVTNYAGAMNTLFANADKPYLSEQTQKQIRDVMDTLKVYNDKSVGDRASGVASRAGALGLDPAALGLGKDEAKGAITDAMEAGRQAQIARMMPNHQAIGGGDGVLQLGAQRAGAGATALPPGTTPTNQQPGGDRVATPVQQAAQPAGQPSPPVGPNGPQPPTPPPAAQAPQQGTPPAPQPGPAGGGTPPAQPAPLTIAGQPVTVPTPPGVSPNFVPALQRIESGKSKDPWTATAGKGPDGKPISSASGAFQMIDKTWNDNKPAGAPNRAKDATPAQQSQAFATLIAKNAQTLTTAGLSVNDTNLYVAHNLGATGASTLLKADPNADARTVVGETAARNNPLFFRGKPTVATVLQRYQAEMNKEPPTLPESGPKPLPGGAEAPGFMTRISRALMQGVPADQRDKAAADVGNAAVEHAPAIGSTIGAVGGTVVGGTPGGMAGGGAGGGAGQALKDYLQGNPQNPAAIAKETALGTAMGVLPGSRLVGPAVRAVSGGAIEAGATAAEGGDAGDIADAGLKGAGYAAGGETFGRALGMIGHKVFSMFAPDARKAVQAAAKTYSEAEATLASEAPKLPGVGGAAGGDNPKYAAAEAAKEKSEQTLKDAGLKPEEAAYAHKVSSEGVPKQEAEVVRPGAVEQQRVGEGYQQLEREVGAAGVGAPKGRVTPLQDGPVTAVMDKKVSAKHMELAQRTEDAIKAPAASWQEKWVQLKDARSALLTAERDALTSTSPGRTREAQDMRALADTVRKQQEKAAKYVFGEKDGEAFMGRLKVLDTRYRNLMEATNGGDLAKAASLKGEAGRDAEKKFVAFAHDDPQAVAAYRAMRGAKGDAFEATVPWTVAAEGIPGVGKVIKVAKLAGMLKEWARERTAGSPVKFSDLVKSNAGAAEVGQSVRDLAGTAAQRGAAMQ